MEFETTVKTVSALRIKHVRVLLSLTRRDDAGPHMFAPEYGMTLGEFCTAYVMTRQRSASMEV